MGRLLRETGEGAIKTNTHHTPRVHSDDTDEFVRESVRRFFKSLNTRGVLSLMRNGVVCFMIDMSNGYDSKCNTSSASWDVVASTESLSSGWSMSAH